MGEVLFQMVALSKYKLEVGREPCGGKEGEHSCKSGDLVLGTVRRQRVAGVVGGQETKLDMRSERAPDSPGGPE